MSNKRDLKAFVRFDGSGRIVAGSLILRKNKPKVGKWHEIQAYECCNYVPTTTTTTTASPTTTTSTTLPPSSSELLAFASGEDGASVACSNASNPSLLSPIYWAPGGVEANVTFFYTDPALTIPAPSGYYSDGFISYAVNVFGLVQVIGSCG